MTEIERLASLFREKPELAQSVQGMTDAATAVDALVRLAAENGIDLNPSEIRDFIDTAMSRRGELTDDQLDGVAGGGVVLGAVFLGAMALFGVAGVTGFSVAAALATKKA